MARDAKKRKLPWYMYPGFGILKEKDLKNPPMRYLYIGGCIFEALALVAFVAMVVVFSWK